jgi:Ni,Fe-hydrogenase III small subunit
MGKRIIFVSNPTQADVLFITGAVNKKMSPWLERVYKQTRKPCLVVAVGTCACSQGLFKGGYSMSGPVDKAVPVDIYIPGCPPKR